MASHKYPENNCKTNIAKYLAMHSVTIWFNKICFLHTYLRQNRILISYQINM